MGTIQSGQILHALFSGLLCSLLVTWAFLVFYRRAVARTMRSVSGNPLYDGTADAALPSARSMDTAGPEYMNMRASGRETGTRLRIAVTYAIAFALSAAVLHAPPMLQLWNESAGGLGAVRALVWWYPYWAASLVIVAALTHASRREGLAAFAAVVAMGMVLSVGVPSAIRIVSDTPLNSELLLNAWYFLLTFAISSPLPLLLIWLTGRPRLRNVLPLVLVMVMTLSLVVAVVYHGFMLLFGGPGVLEPTTIRRIAVTTGPVTIILALALPVGWIAWRAAASVADRYRRRCFSDMQLLADAWWGVIVAFGVAAGWVHGAWVALGCALAAYVVYFATVRALLHWFRLARHEGGPALLLLRVFGHQQRTEQLFDAVAARWRFSGPVTMIAGADLALRSIDVDEALAFAHGEIESSYIAGSVDLGQRLQALHGRTDPDGRYRVEQFFCFDDTWRPTLQALLSRSRVILMDLRGFTRQNAGCIFELQQLASLGRLADCVFVADKDTDRRLAEQSLGMPAAQGPSAATPWVDLSRGDSAAMAALRARLLEVANRSAA